MPYAEVPVTWEGVRGDVYEGVAGVLYTVEPDGAGEVGSEVVTMVLLPDYAPDTQEMHSMVRDAFYNRRNCGGW